MDWDEMYRGRERVFSGEPNEVLVTEVADLAPGQALDVGCGEGADALWLARRGWHVTAIDVSRVALERAAAADDTGRVAWMHADLAVLSPPAGCFDLVSAHYVPLRKAEPGVLRGLLAAVAPGGTVLVASHDPAELTPREGFDPADYYQPADVAALLGPEWTVLADEIRPRARPGRYTRDTVLRARRATG
ncbi:class I SAM-dependent methyltransferase [Amycolatopsis sp. NPDC006131]|uniref:class I SAM-dependent methyltransferase n=1 Tax=Amycolatopsis sp. NPDC006131 TaxID=3156731 RepID=UPI0033AA0F67